MKVGKIYVSMALLFVVAFVGCKTTPEGGYPVPPRGMWAIDNKTPHQFNVTLDREGYVDYAYTVESNTISPISSTSGGDAYTGWACEPLYCEGGVEISFTFENGVCHTFNGEMIDNDVRDSDCWLVLNHSEENTIEHYYIFTTDDYECIMALYE